MYHARDYFSSGGEGGVFFRSFLSSSSSSRAGPRLRFPLLSLSGRLSALSVLSCFGFLSMALNPIRCLTMLVFGSAGSVARRHGLKTMPAMSSCSSLSLSRPRAIRSWVCGSLANLSIGEVPSGIDFKRACTSWTSEEAGPWWQVSFSRSVVDDGLLFCILVDFCRLSGRGIEGKGFLLYSNIRAGSLGMYRGMASGLGVDETSTQSSESVGEGDGIDGSTAKTCSRFHSLTQRRTCASLLFVSYRREPKSVKRSHT